jgi:hypothetical protein
MGLSIELNSNVLSIRRRKKRYSRESEGSTLPTSRSHFLTFKHSTG